MEDYDRSKFLPFVGATLDLNTHLTLYASYAKIFRPQTQYDANQRLLAPVEGDNLEAGIKGEWLGGRLNASAAVFQARQNGEAEYVGFDPDTFASIYEGIDARSQGIEAEVSGQVARGLQLTAGWTALRVRDPDGNPVRTYVPRQTGRLNVTYAAPSFPALKLGASIQYQSDVYRYTTTSVSAVEARVEQGDYALVDLFASYDVGRHVKLGVNVRNVTDAKYLTTLHEDQAYYGEPRSVMGTISFRY